MPYAALGPGDFDAALLRLVERSHLLSPDGLPERAEETAAALGADSSEIFLVSRDQNELVSLPISGRPVQRLSVEGSLAGHAYRHLTPQRMEGDHSRFWVPIVDGAERIGVLGLDVSAEVAAHDQFETSARRLAGILALLIVSKQSYGDSLERTRRTERMSLAGELAWRLLPPLTFGTDRLVVSGSLEPCYDVGGDAFDYAVDGTVAHLAIFDAMGHGLQAGLLATVALAAYRNARRAGAGLEAVARATDEAVAEAFGGDRFATAILATIDTSTGVFEHVRAGHPFPMLLRQHRVVNAVEAEATLPLGIGLDEVEVCSQSLEPGDRILFYTDGVVEARSADGDFFGIDRLGEFAARESSTDAPAPEVLRRLTQRVLAHQEGALQDDATLLLVEWRTDNGDEMHF